MDVWSDKIRNEGDKRLAKASKKITEKFLKWYGHVIRTKEEHIVRRMLDVDIPGKRRTGRPNRRWKDACKGDDRSGVERGQDNKQGRMEEEANQLYRRPQMTGQAREEEDEECNIDLRSERIPCILRGCL